MMDMGEAFHTSCPCPRASSAGVTIARIFPVGEFLVTAIPSPPRMIKSKF